MNYSIQDDLRFPQISTNLSPFIQNLLCIESISEVIEPKVLTDDGFIDFEFVSSCLPACEGIENESPEYFTESVRKLAPMLCSIENWIVTRGEHDICSFITSWTSWTNQQKMMTKLVEMMYVKDEVYDITVLLATTAILERALGDLYLLDAPPPCPSMLKDLLVSRPLEDLLGKDLIRTLRLVIGPPISLNLRNVVWHGFPLPGEIPRRCTWFLLHIIPSIGQVLHRKGILTIEHRVPVVFPELSLIQGQKIVTDDHLLSVLATSQFVGWNCEQFWKHVFMFYQQGMYSLCTALLCYYLEQGLRRVFAVVNECENRILTAESSSLFTTFDEILSPVLPHKENKLRYVIGEGMMEILLDYMVYQDGPRFRDRLSHGEVDWFSFPEVLTDNILTVCVSLAVSFSHSEVHAKTGQIADLQRSVQSYEAQFHRISLIKKMIFQLYREIENFDSVILIDLDLKERDVTSLYRMTGEHLQFEDMVGRVCTRIKSQWSNMVNKTEQANIAAIMPYSHNRDCLCVIEKLLKHKISTLYRDTKSSESSETSQVDGEGEILSILSHVTSECSTTLSQLREFACLRQTQFRDKELRSRQRENLKKFLSSFPSYMVAMKLYGYLVTWQLYHLDALKNRPKTDILSVIRLWKGLLQCCENLRTCTHPDKNKWTEGIELINKHVEQMCYNIDKFFIK